MRLFFHFTRLFCLEQSRKVKEETHTCLNDKLLALEQKGHVNNKQKPPSNFIKNISSRVLDEHEKTVLSYGMKHSLAPKHLPTAKILASVESAIYRENLSAEAKETVRAKVASTLQTSPKPVSNLTKAEREALSRLRKDDSIVITPADKGRVTVVMDKSEYHKKMDTLVNDENTYKKLKSDPSKKLQRNLNKKFWPLHLANIIKKPLYSKLRCSVAQAPKLYGLPKIHKENTPMRPIVSFCSSPTYELSKYLASILKPLTERSEHRLVNSADFITKIQAETISASHELVSLDVKSLFTSIPLKLAIECMEESLANYDDELPIPKEEIIDLLKLCLESTFFQYNGSFYQQLHGTAMGSPVSVAEIVMQRLEERALSSYPNLPPFWFRYVDDTLTSVDKHQKNDFLDHLNKQNSSLQFTMEPEKDGKIAFLDCMITRDGNSLRTSVYRKPTSTSRLLDNSSYHPTSHKSTTIATLVKRAHAVCSSSETLEDELQHLDNVFTINKYSKPFVNSVIKHSRKTTPTTDETERKKTIATIPYIKGTSERIARHKLEFD